MSQSLRGKIDYNKIGNDMFPVGIETLPQELQRNLIVMRTLDQKTEDIKTEIDRCSQKYGQEVGRMSEGEREDKSWGPFRRCSRRPLRTVTIKCRWPCRCMRWYVTQVSIVCKKRSFSEIVLLFLSSSRV